MDTHARTRALAHFLQRDIQSTHDDAIDVSGPRMLSVVVDAWKQFLIPKGNGKDMTEDSLRVVDSTYFYPKVADQQQFNILHICQEGMTEALTNAAKMDM